jgi:lipopolysaccharide export system protein LptA
MRRMKKRTADRRRRIGGAALAVCLLLAGLHPPAFAAEAAGKTKAESKKKSSAGGLSTNKQDPILITADRMEADRQKNLLVYLGQVVAVQGEMTLRSDKLTTYFDPDLAQIKQAIAEGKQVQVTQGDRLATGTKAVFDGVAQTITMTGDPMVRQGNNQVSGERIIFFMVEDRIIVEGGKNKRVEATILPEELQQKKGEGESAKTK